MLKLNFRIRPYRNRDTSCCVMADAIPQVICFDMDTLERLPVPLVQTWSCLMAYVQCDDLVPRQQIFSGRPIRFCKALISLITSRIWSSHGRKPR